MSYTVNTIAPIDPSSTLLAYSLLPAPDPLQVDNPGILTLTVSKSLNSPDGAIDCSQIVVTLPEGTTADALTPDATGIETQVPTDTKGNPLWSADNDGGVITLTPTGKDAGKFRAQGVSFVFAKFKVNHDPGTTTVSIDETASTESDPTTTVRTADILVPKFPAQFSLTDLTLIDPDQPDIPYGGSAELMWTGTGDEVSYNLEYQPADDGPVMSPAVGSQGPYTADNLTRAGSVTFTLTANVTVPGKDSPVVVTRLLTVQIETLSLNFEALPTAVPVNGLVRLSWSAPNAVSCTLEPGNQSLPPNGTLYRLIAESTPFSMVAQGAKGTSKELSNPVTVDPRIMPTEQGYEVTGAPGQPGDNGDPSVPPAGGSPADGSPGGDGEPASFSKTVPPLDLTSNPKRVIPIVLKGGDGGWGGQGGSNFLFAAGGNGGNGGNGGDVFLNLLLDSAAGNPAQFILTLSPGAGGQGGPPGGSEGFPEALWGANGDHGSVKTISIQEK